MFGSVRLAKLVCVVASCCPLSMVVAAPVATPTWSYRVAKGDSLYSVARTYLAPGVSWQKLQRFNRVANPKHLTPGRELRLPVAWLRAEATVAFIRGQAQRDNDGAVLKAGDTLRAGDLLVTEADASVTLQLADASRVLVAGGSRVRMESLLSFGRSGVISSRLGLEKGEADSRVNPAGVRGTEFRVRRVRRVRRVLAREQPGDAAAPRPEIAAFAQAPAPLPQLAALAGVDLATALARMEGDMGLYLRVVQAAVPTLRGWGDRFTQVLDAADLPAALHLAQGIEASLRGGGVPLHVLREARLSTQPVLKALLAVLDRPAP